MTFELYNIVFPLIIAIPIIVEAEIIQKPVDKSLIKIKSIIIAKVEAKETMMKVLKPAACLLLERSQPIMAAKTMDSTILNKVLQIVRSTDQFPSN